MTVGELINSVVQQTSSSFTDQEREATFDDAIHILQTVTIISRAFLDKDIADRTDAAAKERKE